MNRAVQFGLALGGHVAVALHLSLTGCIVAAPHDAHANHRVPECGRRVDVDVEAANTKRIDIDSRKVFSNELITYLKN